MVRPSLLIWRYALVALFCSSGLAYLWWRSQVVNTALPAWSWFVFAAETIGFLWSMTFVFSSVQLAERETPAAAGGLPVDVLVPTYGEPLDVLRRTVMAASAISYPHETWVLDDGDRREVRTLAHELGVHYLARASNVDAKAGNLNHALGHLRGDFIAIFDADHVAQPNFLDRTLGYFCDPGVAFVQTPQEFFNADSHQHLVPERTVSNEHSIFYHVVQRGRDRWNATMFCGCSAVVRRAAIDSIGGFATGTVTEDMHTSVRLHAAGWRSVFHPEILAAGIAPFEGAGFRLQRLRWAQGAMQVAAQERLLRGPGLTWPQRFFYLLHVLNHLEGWRHALFFALPAIVLLTGLSPLRADALSYAAHFAPYFLASVLIYAELGRDHGRLFESEVFNLARCMTSIRATFALFRKRLQFRVTPKVRMRRSDPLGSAFPWLALGLMIVAIADAGWRVAAGRTMFPGGSFVIVLGWALYSFATAARLLLHERRCSRNRRGGTRFRGAVPALLQSLVGGPGQVAVEIIAAEADGFTLRPLGTAHLPAGRYSGTLSLAGATFTFEVALRGVLAGGVGGGPVTWANAAARAEFDLALHRRAIGRLAAADRGDFGGILAPLFARVPVPRLAAHARAGIVALVALGALLVCRTSAQGDDTLVLAGTDQSTTSSYVYAGSIISLSGNLAQSGPLLRIWADRLNYDYTTNGQRINAASWGEDLAAGYQHVSGQNVLSGYVGIDDRTTALFPAVSSRIAGTRTGARAEVDADQTIAGPLAINAVASYVTGSAEYWSRAQLLYRLGGTLRLGPEATWQGDPDYHGSRIGATLAGISLGKLSLGLNGGSQRINGAAGGYGSVSLSAAF
jgi:cellulose synthase/poly-beta-1,6-N-acetylglucosamine synthase-like glycosyltransferase